MSTNITLIETKTVGAGGSSNIEFTGLGSYSSTYTDLYLVCSLRTDAAFTADNLAIQFNGLGSTNFTARNIYTTGSGTPVVQNFSIGEVAGINATGTTSTTFSNTTIHISEFASSNYKSISTDSAIENAASRGDESIYSTLWSNTAAITSLRLVSSSGANFVQNSTVSLYGISKVTSTPKATGGIISQDNTYWYHMFPFTSTFTPTQALTVDYLVVAGGGAGGGWSGSTAVGASGGGGAGGVICTVGNTGGLGTLPSALNLTTQAYTITVGAGGATGNGSDSSISGSGFTTITAIGGGRGGTRISNNASTGGSGGGGYGDGSSNPGAAGTSGQGFAGGNGSSVDGGSSGGGGGAGAAGQNGFRDGSSGDWYAGDGGIGIQTSISGVSTYYGGGGGGGSAPQNGGWLSAPNGAGAGGLGGGGRGAQSNPNGQSAQAGTIHTGGGGGGRDNDNNYVGLSGGSGIVIIRYAK